MAAGVAPRGRAGRRHQEGGSAEVTEDGIGGLGVGAGSLDPEGEWRRPPAPGAGAATREGAGRARLLGGGAFCLPSPAAPRLVPLPPATLPRLPLLLTLPPGPSGARSRPCFVWTEGGGGSASLV